MSQKEVVGVVIIRYDSLYLLPKGAEMPNWCTNTLTVKGDSQATQDFLRRIKTTNEDGAIEYRILPNLFPTPEELQITSTTAWEEIPENWSKWVDEGTWSQAEYDERVAKNFDLLAKQKSNMEKYGYKDWYSWCVDNWGSKWGDCDTEVLSEYEGGVDIRFDSAWSPPVDGIAHISKMFPSLLFVLTFEEMGMDYYGSVVIRNGAWQDSEGKMSELASYEAMGDWEDTEKVEAFYDELSDAKEKCENEALAKMGEKW